MAKPPRRPGSMSFSGATPPVAVPDPPPEPAAVTEAAAPLAAVPDPVPEVVPVVPDPVPDPVPAETNVAEQVTAVAEETVTAEDTAGTAGAADEAPVVRPRRRQPDKHTIYPDVALKDKLEDLTLRLQRTHRKRAGGRVDKGVIHDAILTVALAHPAEIDKYLRDYLS